MTADARPKAEEPRPLRARAEVWAAPLVAGVLAAAARLVTWADVFTPGGVRFVMDTDTHYHVLRARRILDGFASTLRFDPFLNFPYGAEALWPPLFDYAIAVPSMLLGGTQGTTETVAALVSPVLGIATVVLATAVARVFFGWRAGLAAGVTLALLSPHVWYTVLGRPDQHSAETLLSTALFATFMMGVRARAARGWAGPALLGVLIALSFWNWMGSGVYLVVLASFVALWHLAAPPDGSDRMATRLLVLGTGTGALLLAASLAIVHPGALASLSAKGITAFHVLLSGAVAIFGAVLWRLQRGAPAGKGRRILHLLAATAVPLLALATLPPLRRAVGTDLAALFAANRWYARIAEFEGLFGRHRGGVLENLEFVGDTFGLTLAVAPLAIALLIRRIRAAGTDAAPAAFLVHWTSLFVLASLFRVRFGLYAAVPLALSVGVLLDEISRRIEAVARPRAVPLSLVVPLIGALAVVFPCDRGGEHRDPAEPIEAALRWLRADPPVGGREAVLADWPLGHIVQYFAGRPVIVSPFGTDGGAGAMEAGARFYLARAEADAEGALVERRVGYVLLGDPPGNAWMAAGFAPAPPPELLRLTWPDASAMPDSFGEWPMTRLYYFDGGSVGGRLPGLGGFRLLFDTPPVAVRVVPEGMFKLFGFVAGARVSVQGLPPGAPAEAEVSVLTNTGRAFLWRTWTVADGAGTADFRVPYATGENGLVRASPCRVTSASRSAAVPITEDQVRYGQRVIAALSPR